MRLGFRVLNKNAVIPELENNVLTFHSAAPVVLQSTELRRIKTGLAVQVEKGYSLQIVVHPSLQEKNISVFPSPLVIDSSHSGELFIFLQNHGREQINLFLNDSIAKGSVVKVEGIEIIELEPEAPPPPKKKTKPQKKNIEFTLHGRQK
jgi:dUTP pyrophosphatase